MEIINIEFESSLVVINGKQKIKITVFKTPEHGNIKLGIDAPRGVSVNREEIYIQKQEKIKKCIA
jgi:carbon storage regulator